MTAKKDTADTRTENVDPPSDARVRFMAGEIPWHTYCQIENQGLELPEPPVTR